MNFSFPVYIPCTPTENKNNKKYKVLLEKDGKKLDIEIYNSNNMDTGYERYIAPTIYTFTKDGWVLKNILCNDKPISPEFQKIIDEKLEALNKIELL